MAAAGASLLLTRHDLARCGGVNKDSSLPSRCINASLEPAFPRMVKVVRGFTSHFRCMHIGPPGPSRYLGWLICGDQKTLSGDCLDAPAFHRNHAPIADVLRRLFGDKNGNIIEIGSGTGQHLVTFAAALPRLIWWPSDPNPIHRDSIDAWQAKRALANVRSSVDIDAAAPDWALGRDGRPPADDPG